MKLAPARRTKQPKQPDFVIGDHVELKGMGLYGYSGIIIGRSAWAWHVRLDEGQLRAGHNVLRVGKNNMRKVA